MSASFRTANEATLDQTQRLLWIYGLVIGKESMANFVPRNSEDDRQHFVLGVSMIRRFFLAQVDGRPGWHPTS